MRTELGAASMGCTICPMVCLSTLTVLAMFAMSPCDTPSSALVCCSLRRSVAVVFVVSPIKARPRRRTCCVGSGECSLRSPTMLPTTRGAVMRQSSRTALNPLGSVKTTAPTFVWPLATSRDTPLPWPVRYRKRTVWSPWLQLPIWSNVTDSSPRVAESPGKNAKEDPPNPTAHGMSVPSRATSPDDSRRAYSATESTSPSNACVSVSSAGSNAAPTRTVLNTLRKYKSLRNLKVNTAPCGFPAPKAASAVAAASAAAPE
mmetsp:Transcript_15784/g.38334  ORF Transcript_15784/g.38334 Transcript_15784/m.38334 type:complete len:260 (+) Transcript_15784:13233-14012(+)